MVAFPDKLPEDYWSKASIIVASSPYEELESYVVETLLHTRLLTISCVGEIPEVSSDTLGNKFVKSGGADNVIDACKWILSIDKNEAVEF